ncbi:MAG: hypothetical protein LBV49_10735 [Azonexus sp.]|jgi:hypothetical protein|nr:hypothetical protein [Azonexus sp.]
MIGDEKKRATLDFGDLPTAPAPRVDTEMVKQVARAAGFRETPKAPDTAPIRSTLRRRRKTGRTEQFATRLRADTLEAIHGYADRHEVTLAETIERAMSALIRNETRG